MRHIASDSHSDIDRCDDWWTLISFAPDIKWNMSAPSDARRPIRMVLFLRCKRAVQDLACYGVLSKPKQPNSLRIGFFSRSWGYENVLRLARRDWLPALRARKMLWVFSQQIVFCVRECHEQTRYSTSNGGLGVLAMIDLAQPRSSSAMSKENKDNKRDAGKSRMFSDWMLSC